MMMKPNHSYVSRWLAVVCWFVGLSAWTQPGAAQTAYARAGWQATLSTVSHGVRGTVTILDDNTYQVDDFFYDGLGITVFSIWEPRIRGRIFFRD